MERLTDAGRLRRGHAVPAAPRWRGRRRPGARSCGSGSSASSGTRSTSRARSASTSGTRIMDAGETWASGRSAWRRSGSSGWRSSTSWSARTPTRCPIPYGAGLRWIVKMDKADFLGQARAERADDEARRRSACRASRRPATSCRPRARRGPRRHVGRARHLGAEQRRGRRHRRHGLGARGVGEDGDAVRDPVRPAVARTRTSRCSPSTTPTARGCGRERADPSLAASRVRSTDARCRDGPGGGLGARRALRRRGVRDARRLRERVAVADVTARGKIDVQGVRSTMPLSAAGDVLDRPGSPTTGLSC